MAFSYTHGLLIPRGHSIADHYYKRGVAVLRWADDEIAQDREMVQFLVWSNPSNLAYASAALKGDYDIVKIACQSPFYKQASPAMPEHCILRYADDKIRKDRAFVLDLMTHSKGGQKHTELPSASYEIQFIGGDLKNDKTLIAWAGAPHGAIGEMFPDKDFLQFLNDIPVTGISVSYVEENQERVFTFQNKFLVTHLSDNYGRKPSMEHQWARYNNSEKIEWCKRLWGSITGKLPLFFSVSLAMRKVLWPTLELPTQLPTQLPTSMETDEPDEPDEDKYATSAEPPTFALLARTTSDSSAAAADAWRDSSDSSSPSDTTSACPNFARNGFWGSEVV